MNRDSRGWLITLLAVLLLGLLLLTWDLAETPLGPTIDEVSIGSNAWQVGALGVDEHGISTPLYFHAFTWGAIHENKNPLYIYLLVPFELLFGPSHVALRLPAVLLALWLACVLGLCVLELWRQGLIDVGRRGGRILALGVGLAALTMPWCYHFGRVALEAISYPSTLVTALWLSLICRRRPRLALGCGAGLVWGLTLYSYSTARMMVPLLLVAFALTQLRWIRRHWPVALTFTAGVALAALPLVVFVLQQPKELTAKFYTLTVCQRHPQGVSELLSCLTTNPGRGTFINQYGSCFSFEFLFRAGDRNLLHAVQGHGALHLYWMLPVALGLLWLWRQRRSGLARFFVCALALAPLAAAMMNAGQHSIRAYSAFPFWILLGAAGLGEGAALVRRARPQLQRGIVAVLLLLALGETVGYLYDYHRTYRAALLRGRWQVAWAEAVREAIRFRGPEGVLYLPHENPRNRRLTRRRLDEGISVFWRYYLRIPGSYKSPVPARYRVSGKPPPADAPRGSTVIVIPRRRRGRQYCPELPGGFAPVSAAVAPPPDPKIRLCVLLKQ